MYVRYVNGFMDDTLLMWVDSKKTILHLKGGRTRDVTRDFSQKYILKLIAKGTYEEVTVAPIKAFWNKIVRIFKKDMP